MRASWELVEALVKEIRSAGSNVRSQSHLNSLPEGVETDRLAVMMREGVYV